MKVTVTVSVGDRVVALERVADQRIVAAFRATADQLGRRLRSATCPAHGEPPREVRVHFDARGDLDLSYDVCCDRIADAIRRALS